MIYPKNFEEKIGFAEIRHTLSKNCLSSLGQEEAEKISFSSNIDEINHMHRSIKEMQTLLATYPEFPRNNYYDQRNALKRLRLEGTHAEETELHDIQRSLQTAIEATSFLLKKESDEKQLYPTLAEIVDEITIEYTHKLFIQLSSETVKQIIHIIDENGIMRDSASKQLLEIREEKRRREKSITRTLYSILNSAQKEGLIEKDVTPTIRDSRLVIPIAPAIKRRIPGIVHDESATGKTVYVEPTEVVEANNRIRELEAEERREIIKILTEFANELRPNINIILLAYKILAKIDIIYAKTRLAEQIRGIAIQVEKKPIIDWIRARHPLLEASLSRQGKQQVPLDIMLTAEKRMLIISGPNAGGKSVCLKTVGLLQYMLQCGLPIPIDERSKAGVFRNIMLDMGDEQSIDDDLSTYSSHLINMKQMVRSADKQSLLLIDEFGGGTEPIIGGAISEAVLKQFWKAKAWGVITTHYQNLKQFADSHDGIVNGAMLYDRHEMRPLFSLEIGRPGSSFAIEIAKKIGLPKEVIDDATEIVGSDIINSDKYLQDIVRDKRYWENKRQTIHKREKDIEKTISRFEHEVSDIESSRKEILRKAKEQAEELLKETNRRIENTIREIKEQQAEKENTRKLREELDAFRAEIEDIDRREQDEKIARKIKQIQERQKRKEERRQKKQSEANNPINISNKEKVLFSDSTSKKDSISSFSIGNIVKIKGTNSIGKIESIEGKTCIVIFGTMRSKIKTDRLEHDTEKENKAAASSFNLVNQSVSRQTRQTIDQRQNTFKPELDVRGMRAEEALNTVMYYLDDAILVGSMEVRILHGTGNGILRQLIRQYLSTQPHIASYRDEHVQFGGAGITVVRLAF